MAKDLRTYLAELKESLPGDLIHVRKEVDPNLELTAVLRKLQEQNRYPALLFENVKGTEIPVLANLIASRDRVALAMGTTSAELARDYVKKEKDRRPTLTVDSGPVKDVVYKGGEVDLTKLPNIVHCGNDGGPYISSGMTITKDPDTGIPNMGIYRLQIKGKNRLGFYLGEYSHGKHIFNKYDTKGMPCEVAIVIGHHPCMYMAAQYRGPLDVNELEIAGGLLGEPVRMVKAETVDLEVPADAEIVIEGRTIPGLREWEGPFGEYTWYLGDAVENPVIEVTAITHRKDPIYQDIFSAHPEHNVCGLVGHEALLYRKLKEAIPQIKDVCVPFSGTCRHSVYLSVYKEYDGLGKNALLTALSAHPFIKLAVVVDDDIDVYNESEVMWAVNTRVQPDRDVFIVPDCYVCELDPSAYSIKDRAIRGALNAKWGIDATKPAGLPFQPRADVPEELWKNLNLNEYIADER